MMFRSLVVAGLAASLCLGSVASENFVTNCTDAEVQDGHGTSRGLKKHGSKGWCLKEIWKCNGRVSKCLDDGSHRRLIETSANEAPAQTGSPFQVKSVTKQRTLKKRKKPRLGPKQAAIDKCPLQLAEELHTCQQNLRGCLAPVVTFELFAPTCTMENLSQGYFRLCAQDLDSSTKWYDELEDGAFATPAFLEGLVNSGSFGADDGMPGIPLMLTYDGAKNDRSLSGTALLGDEAWIPGSKEICFNLELQEFPDAPDILNECKIHLTQDAFITTPEDMQLDLLAVTEDDYNALFDRGSIILATIGDKLDDLTPDRSVEILGMDRKKAEDNKKQIKFDGDKAAKAAKSLSNLIKSCKGEPDCGGNLATIVSGISDLLITLGPLLAFASPGLGTILSLLGGFGVVLGALLGSRSGGSAPLTFERVERAVTNAVNRVWLERDMRGIVTIRSRMRSRVAANGKRLASLERLRSRPSEFERSFNSWLGNFDNEWGFWLGWFVNVESVYRGVFGPEDDTIRGKLRNGYLELDCEDKCGYLDSNGNFAQWKWDSNFADPGGNGQVCQALLVEGETAYITMRAFAAAYLETAVQAIMFLSSTLSILQEGPGTCDPNKYTEQQIQDGCLMSERITSVRDELRRGVNFYFKLAGNFFAEDGNLDKVCLTDQTSQFPFGQKCKHRPIEKDSCNYPIVWSTTWLAWKIFYEPKNNKGKLTHIIDGCALCTWPGKDLSNWCGGYYEANKAVGFGSEIMFANGKSYTDGSTTNRCESIAHDAWAWSTNLEHKIVLASPNFCIRSGRSNNDACKKTFTDDKKWGFE